MAAHTQRVIILYIMRFTGRSHRLVDRLAHRQIST